MAGLDPASHDFLAARKGKTGMPAGGFVRGVAHSPHDDGVRKDGKEPAVIIIFGDADRRSRG